MSKENDPALYESGFERQPKDRYWTEHWVTSALLRRLDPPDMVWEPAAGRGDIVRVLQDHGCDVFASDVDMSEFDAGLCDCEEMDFFSLPTNFDRYDLTAIITNPPYDKAQQFIERSFEMDVDTIAVLLRSEFKSAGGRTWMFEDGFQDRLFAYEVVLTSRPRWDWWFRDKPIASPRHNFSWFVWERGRTEPCTTYWEGRKPREKS